MVRPPRHHRLSLPPSQRRANSCLLAWPALLQFVKCYSSLLVRPPRAVSRISAAGETGGSRLAMAAPVRPVAPSRAKGRRSCVLLARGLTLRSSRAPTARRAGQQALALRPILRLLSSTPRCRARLNSNVRLQMLQSVCALCLKPAELQDSHIIPNAYFKRMKWDNAGKLIAFDTSENSEARPSIESWSEDLLCKDCEQRFSKWETASIEMLRRTGHSIERSGNHGGLIERYNYSILRLFLLSILWRSAVSTLQEFSEIVLPTEFQERLRLALCTDDNASGTVALHCRLMKIVDDAKVFTAKNFENIAVSPSIEPSGASGKCTFIFGGYLVEYFVPQMPLKIRRTLGVLKHQEQQFVPVIPMTSIPKLMNLFVAGRHKKLTGKVAR